MANRNSSGEIFFRKFHAEIIASRKIPGVIPVALKVTLRVTSIFSFLCGKKIAEKV
jgi:hypothetical protein